MLDLREREIEHFSSILTDKESWQYKLVKVYMYISTERHFKLLNNRIFEIFGIIIFDLTCQVIYYTFVL
jgi:hypothetical protein